MGVATLRPWLVALLVFVLGFLLALALRLPQPPATPSTGEPNPPPPAVASSTEDSSDIMAMFTLQPWLVALLVVILGTIIVVVVVFVLRRAPWERLRQLSYENKWLGAFKAWFDPPTPPSSTLPTASKAEEAEEPHAQPMRIAPVDNEPRHRIALDRG